MCSADIPGICERVKKHLQLIKYMMFWVHAHNPCLIEVYLCYVVKLNFHRMFVIKVKKARTVVHTIKKLQKIVRLACSKVVCISHLLNSYNLKGLNSADQYVHGYTRVGYSCARILSQQA